MIPTATDAANGNTACEVCVMDHPPATSAALSVHRAFVVEFHAEADFRAGRVSGRVEHVVSGRALVFQSQEALLAFMAQLLREVRDDAAQL
jgi:hypothetical protein